MDSGVEGKNPGSQAGRLAQGTLPRGPHTLPPPSTQVAPPHMPGPQGWSLGSRARAQTHTHTHTHCTHHTPKGIRGPNPGKKFFTKGVKKFASIGRERDRVRKKKKHGALSHPCWLPHGKEIWGNSEAWPQILVALDLSPLTFHNPEHLRA